MAETEEVNVNLAEIIPTDMSSGEQKNSIKILNFYVVFISPGTYVLLHCAVSEIEIPTLDTNQSAEEATPTIGKRKRQVRGPHESKDPNAPRRPQTAYMMYTTDVRKDVRLENPDLSVSERAKIISRMWADLEESKKKVSLLF